MRISQSSLLVEPFLAMEIMERAQDLEREGTDVVHLEVGEPDFEPPACVQAALADAVRAGRTHYTHSLGEQELREAISSYYARTYGVRLDPHRVIVTTGSSAGLLLLAALLLDPGDSILLPDPGYACYPNFIRSFHGIPRTFPVEAEDGFVYDSAAVRRSLAPGDRAILLNSPGNPTGVLQPPRGIREIIELGVPVISDEIYHGLTYESPAGTALQWTDDVFVLDGFSKRYSMTGFRIGWLVVPPAAVAPIQRLQQNLFICAPSHSQHAALAALREGDADVAAMRREYAARRDLLLTGLAELGLPVPARPTGAYYAFVDVRRLGLSSLELARRLLHEAHVGVTPGMDFGARGEGYLRISFASSRPRIEEGVRRLRKWLEERDHG